MRLTHQVIAANPELVSVVHELAVEFEVCVRAVNQAPAHGLLPDS